MKRLDVKSHCPINYTVEIFGDAWSLLIYRDMAAVGRNSFGDFLKMQERIGTSVLAEKLAHLEKNGIIQKRRDPNDGRRVRYEFTARGISALPLYYEVAAWGSHASPHPAADPAWFAALALDRAVVLAAWKKALESGSSFFCGEQSVVKQLGL